MLIVSYDIADTKLRTKFSKMLIKHGAIRLQYSVYEINNTQRILDNIKVKIKADFITKFTLDDSVMVFEVKNDKIEKYGNAIHRDKDLLFFD